MDGALTLVTAPTIEPVSLAEAKLHCRIDDDQTDEDALLHASIRLAREHLERVYGYALISTTWDLSLPGFPACEAIAFPRRPLQSVTSVTYTNSGNTATVWAASNYLVDTAAFVGRLVPAYGVTWPSFTARPINPVVVRFVAGYGDDAGSVPEGLRQALLMLVGELYEHREITVPNTNLLKAPYSFEMLAGVDRLWSF